MISSLLDALSNIHVSTYIHNDLKCDNVIVEEDRTAVIIDYSKSKFFCKLHCQEEEKDFSRNKRI